MAQSSNYTLIALLVAFAVLLHQSAAARDGGAAKATAAPAPSANGDDVVLHPSATYEIPDLPLPRILPCPPVFPKIPFIPCYNVTPPAPPAPPRRPKECRPSLVMLMPTCSGYLTNSSVPEDSPSENCCDGLKLFLSGKDPSFYYPLCLCHIENGDVNQLLTKPVDHARALSLVHACLGIDPNTYYGICNDDIVRKEIPPMELPKPPKPAPGNKA